MKAVLVLKRVDFKRHKDVLAYFNQHYIKTEKFPQMISKKIREDSDYDDEFIPTDDETKIQIDTAREIIGLVEKYFQNL